MHDHHDHAHHTSITNLKTVFFINLCFTVIEVVGGVLTGSIAIISDALHDLGDSVSLGFSWAFEKLSFKKRTARYTYGYKRFSLLGGLITAVMLIIGSVFVISEAVKRIIEPVAVNATGMMGLAVLGLAVNTLAALRVRRGKKITERIVIIMQFTYLPILDPLLSLCIAVFVLTKIYPQLKATLNIFLQHAPLEFDITATKTQINKIKHVRDVHDLHIWTLDGEYHVVTLHVVVTRGLPEQETAGIKSKVRSLLSGKGIDHITVEVEREDEECLNCDTEEAHS